MKLHVEESGTAGPALVLCHGFGGSARNFRGQVRGLGDRCRLFAYDARGHARSEAPVARAEYRPECFVGDMLEIVDRAGDERAIVGGLSMGAGIALRFALAHPDRVRALVLVSFPRSADDPGHRTWALAFADAIETRGLEAAGAEFVWGQGSNFDDRAKALVRTGFLEHSAHGIAHTLRELLAVQPSVASMSAALGTIAVPTLVIAGERDPRSMPASRALAERIPGAELVIVPDGGHLVNLTHPNDFNRAILGLIQRENRRMDGH